MFLLYASKEILILRINFVNQSIHLLNRKLITGKYHNSEYINNGKTNKKIIEMLYRYYVSQLSNVLIFQKVYNVRMNSNVCDNHKQKLKNTEAFFIL